jgi:hypothetical protein
MLHDQESGNAGSGAEGRRIGPTVSGNKLRQFFLVIGILFQNLFPGITLILLTQGLACGSCRRLSLHELQAQILIQTIDLRQFSLNSRNILFVGNVGGIGGASYQEQAHAGQTHLLDSSVAGKS